MVEAREESGSGMVWISSAETQKGVKVVELRLKGVRCCAGHPGVLCRETGSKESDPYAQEFAGAAKHLTSDQRAPEDVRLGTYP